MPPWSRSIPADTWDAVVVGSGVGGLSAAALLAMTGRRVLVLERHLRPGGFTQTFRRGAARWDVGVHVVGEVSEAELPGRLLAALTGGRLQWASVGATVDRVVDAQGLVVELPVGSGAVTDAIERAHPGSAPAVRRYLQECRQVSQALGRHVLARSLPEAGRAFASGTDPRAALRAVGETARAALARSLPAAVRPVMGMRWGYLGTPLDDLSFAALASATAHFLDGAYYPVGGAGQIATQLAQTVADCGGAVVTGHGAAVLEVDAAGVRGVCTDAGQHLATRCVVSGIGARSTVDRLLPPAIGGDDWIRAIRSLPHSMPHVALYLALSEDPRAHGIDGANVWGVDAGTREVGWYASFPSVRDPAWKGPHLASIVRMVDWQVHAAMAAGAALGDTYTRYKAGTGEALLRAVEPVFPWLRGSITGLEVATPATVIRYVGAPEGASYGLAATAARFSSPALAARTPVPGLFLAGADVALPGVVGALMGGVVAAAAAGGPPALGVLLQAARAPAGSAPRSLRLRR